MKFIVGTQLAAVLAAFVSGVQWYVPGIDRTVESHMLINLFF